MPASQSRHHEENKLAYAFVYEGASMPEAKLNQQIIAGAAAYRTVNEYEKKRQAVEAEPDAQNFHDFAKNSAAEEVDKIIVTRELTGMDAAHITSLAVEQAEAMFNATHRPESYSAPPEDWGYGLIKRHTLEQAHGSPQHREHEHEHGHHHHGAVTDDGVPELDPKAKAKVEIKTYTPHSPAPYGNCVGTYGGFDGPPGGVY